MVNGHTYLGSCQSRIQQCIADTVLLLEGLFGNPNNKRKHFRKMPIKGDIPEMTKIESPRGNQKTHSLLQKWCHLTHNSCKILNSVHVKSGVLQETVLGPIVCIIMISELGKELFCSVVFKYADDTKNTVRLSNRKGIY